MPHPRFRHLTPWIEQYIKAAASLCLVGQRQTGKTTLFQALAKQEFKLDRESVRADLERNLQSRLQKGPFPILLDEAQKLPALFDEIKGLIDERKTPGRYLLTGSVRFSSKKSIRESLTGRTLVLELLPMGIAEAHHKPLSSVWDLLFDPKCKLDHKLFSQIESQTWASPRTVAQFLQTGGLPGICFQRNETLRSELIQSHIDTLLGRDLLSLYPGKLSSNKLRLFLALLASQQGEPLNLSGLARKVGTTSPTLNNYLKAFQALFLVRELGKTYYFEDQGMASFLQQHSQTLPSMDARRFLFVELLQQIHYRYRSRVLLENYTPKRGIPISFILTPPHPQRKLALITEGEEVASSSSIKALSWYLKKHPHALGMILHSGNTATQHTDRIFSLPLHWVC